MVIPDANLLIYTFNRNSAYHPQAKTWWEGLLDGTEYIGLDWSVLVTFLRLTTNPILFPNGVNVEDSLKAVRSWLELGHVHIIHPGSSHFEILSSLLIQARIGHNLVPDVHLAALAIENRATLHSHDRDFQRFSGLKLVDPLAKK